MLSDRTGFARAPRPQRARRRPRLRSQVVGRPVMGLPQPQRHRQTARPAPRAAAPTLGAPAATGIQYAPPPVTSTGAGIRAGANESWTGAQTSYRDSIFRAAMQLGDPNVIAKLRRDPQFAGYKFASDPNSVFAQLGRQEKEGLLDVDNTSNSNNTFFSGLRLNDRRQLSDQVGRDRGSAVLDYEDALRDYAGALATARGGYNSSLRDADTADLTAATARAPEATGALPPVAARPSAPAAASNTPRHNYQGPSTAGHRPRPRSRPRPRRRRNR